MLIRDTKEHISIGRVFFFFFELSTIIFHKIITKKKPNIIEMNRRNVVICFTYIYRKFGPYFKYYENNK